MTDILRRRIRDNESWPRWNRQCSAIKWRTGERCRRSTIIGSDKCKNHGGGGEVGKDRAWRRYLLWAMLPDAVRASHHAPVTMEEIEILSQALVEAALKGTPETSARVKMKAAEYLLDSAAVQTHEDPALLLTHLSREDAETAWNILRQNGLCKGVLYRTSLKESPQPPQAADGTIQ